MTTHTIQIESYVIDQIRCPECALTCLQKNIYRHMTQMHNWTNQDCKALVTAIRTEKKNRESKTSFACSYCRVLFRSVKNLMQHKRICSSQPQLQDIDGMEDVFVDEMIVEGEEEVVGMEEYLEAETVSPEEEQQEEQKPSTSSEGNSFEMMPIPPHRQSARAIPSHHLSQESIENAQIAIEEKLKFPLKFPLSGRHRGSHLKCPECPITAESLDDFLSHCREKHQSDDRKFHVERRIFESRDDFKKWFDQRQEDTCTSLTKRTGHGGETLYRCHRVGKYQSVAKSRKSNPRKIDQTCTAYLKVTTEDDGSTWVNGCFTHIGHDLDHKLLWLTETQENYVRELIDLGWTSDQIFFYIRNEYKDYECKLKYVSKNDIRNITVRYNREKQKLGHEFLPEDKTIPFQLGQRKEQLEIVVNSQQQTSDELNVAVVREEEEEEIKSKIARFEDPSEDVKVHQEVVEAAPSEDVVVNEVQVEPIEEEEYINVVDDDTMPALDRISG